MFSCPHQVTNPLVDKYTSYQGANSSTIDEMMYKLPTYQVMASPNFTWGSIDGGHFRALIDQAYQEVVHWRKNMFQVPWGTSGKQFMSELARLFQAHAEATALESVAITAAMVMPHLLLQRPNVKSKPRDHASCPTRRMPSWLEGDIQGLLREARTIQLHLGNRAQSCRSNMKTDSSRKFANYMKKGDDRAAGRFLSDEADCGVLSLDECIDDGLHQLVREILKKKHPDPAPLVPDAVLDPGL